MGEAVTGIVKMGLGSSAAGRVDRVTKIDLSLKLEEEEQDQNDDEQLVDHYENPSSGNLHAVIRDAGSPDQTYQQYSGLRPFHYTKMKMDEEAMSSPGVRAQASVQSPMMIRNAANDTQGPRPAGGISTFSGAAQEVSAHAAQRGCVREDVEMQESVQIRNGVFGECRDRSFRCEVPNCGSTFKQKKHLVRSPRKIFPSDITGAETYLISSSRFSPCTSSLLSLYSVS
jgi:hypothetical protein